MSHVAGIIIGFTEPPCDCGQDGCRRHTLYVEASDLGLRAGEWPPGLAAVSATVGSRQTTINNRNGQVMTGLATLIVGVGTFVSALRAQRKDRHV